jgi:hypothetical protein
MRVTRPRAPLSRIHSTALMKNVEFDGPVTAERNEISGGIRLSRAAMTTIRLSRVQAAVECGARDGGRGAIAPDGGRGAIAPDGGRGAGDGDDWRIGVSMRQYVSLPAHTAGAAKEILRASSCGAQAGFRVRS